jgi:hypothetical protein
MNVNEDCGLLDLRHLERSGKLRLKKIRAKERRSAKKRSREKDRMLADDGARGLGETSGPVVSDVRGGGGDALASGGPTHQDVRALQRDDSNLVDLSNNNILGSNAAATFEPPRLLLEDVDSPHGSQRLRQISRVGSESEADSWTESDASESLEEDSESDDASDDSDDGSRTLSSELSGSDEDSDADEYRPKKKSKY